ncbi:hydrogenase maturation nickel metallochaperone HypA/HybF [Campylobacter canadensis]|uniref:Hydrogenase maturation factor HypA n=1 Tax=Campylobacter canadensis TaxID=449520 RepID=A0ABS7WU92_9BACT|nr:hydrogenase maturation nickel metallochaperone HypA [Campylobacter canadensis]MBZ7987897.1 hydrogenase maturation nickel metallochaperone HypA [Campylobacter canadensis]MBZ7995347.1 hydrogenase maturation nickel metallochaperone HypA [Campylobacter canadensis]MBZ7996327.1 hydrogenase maturation nickel metallochaperone HypA [Campylobacter canadensis]MBZ7998359.1 hydrogenase maturation nickel metallochaperone HypA [Campylobacter canadensis]MBZ8000074.1 hydrogenase maturation nickel metallocha
MHEMAIVNNLLNECEKIAKQKNAKKINAVYVSLGRLSGVEEHYFKEAFNAFVQDENSIYYKAKLYVSVCELELFCFDCAKNCIQEKNEFICKHCSSVNVKVLKGDEMLLNSIELDV